MKKSLLSDSLFLSKFFSFNLSYSQQIKCEKNKYYYFGKFSKTSESYIMITDFVSIDNKYWSDLKVGYGFIKDVFNNGNKKIIAFSLSCTKKNKLNVLFK